MPSGSYVNRQIMTEQLEFFGTEFLLTPGPALYCVKGEDGEDEIYDPMEFSCRVKLFTDGCPRRLSGRLSTLAVRAGERKSRWQVNCRSGGLCLLCLSSRASSRPPDDRPCARLKASTPHEAPTPALTTKTLAAVDSRWGRVHENWPQHQ